MGGALLTGWLKSGIITPKELIILDPHPGEAAQKAIEKGALHLKKPTKDLKSIKYLLLSIKPQMFKSLAPLIAKHLHINAVIISILAGTSLNTLQNAFEKQAIIRAMPNTPAAIGKGITAYTVGSGVSAQHIKMTERLLAAGGKVHEVANENLIDVVTAVSGSGPAYVFHLVEALEAAAINIGMPIDLAPDFARHTIIGSASLLETSAESAAKLRLNVTSPNGTTQAALDVLMGAEGLPVLMRETVQAALKRAKELGES